MAACQKKYEDGYYERALYNHILATQEPEKGMHAYFMSLNVYWQVLPESEWSEHRASIEAERKRKRQEEARIVGPGEQQSEIDHKTNSKNSQVGDLGDSKWRDARHPGWFEYTLKT